MNIRQILSLCDHTQLATTARWEDIRNLCDEGIRYGTASVCIPPSYVKRAKEYVGDKLCICTVIGFPNGYSTTAVKCFEAEAAIGDGADEIDMVINLGDLKDGQDDVIASEIRSVKEICGEHILKVIIETCQLTEEEKIRMCHIVTDAGADYIKTSTGFSIGGATREDVALMRANVGKNVKVKAAGGIRNLTDAEDMIALGAERLGTSRVVSAAKGIMHENDTTY